MMKFLKQILTFLALVILAHSLLYYFSPNNSKEITLLEQINQAHQQHKKIVILGDSSIRFTTEEEKDKRSISQMLGSILKTDSIADFSDTGRRPELNLEILKNMIKKGYTPKTVIMPISMRVFGVRWNLSPYQQFVREKLFLKNDHPAFRLMFKPLAIFKTFNFNPISEDEYYHTSLYIKDEPQGMLYEMLDGMSFLTEEEIVSRENIMGFSYLLDDTHRQVDAIKKIIDISNRHNIQLICYISPYEHHRISKKLLNLIEENEAFITKVFASKNSTLTNLGTILEKEDFVTSIAPTSHYTSTGRFKITLRLADLLTL